MNKFAEGPWSLGKMRKTTQWIDAADWQCLAKVYVKVKGMENAEGILQPNLCGEANARLISKAPEMYELLLKLAPLYGTAPEISAQIHTLRYFVEEGPSDSL